MRFVIAFALASIMGFDASVTLAQDNASILQCLRTKVALADAKIVSREPYGGSIEVTVTNNLSWALSGIYLEYVVRSADRSVPWLTDKVADSIAGGIEPRETRTIKTYFSGLSDDVPADVILEVALLDVGDTTGNQVLLETRILGDNWTQKKSELGCN